MRNLLSSLIILFVSFASAEVVSDAKDVSPLGTGEPVPSVTVTDIDGTQLDLARLVHEQPSVLVFYRGSWCPYCNRHLAALQEVEKDLKMLGFRILAISPDKPGGLKEATSKNDLSYTLLSDSKAEAIEAFGLGFKVGLATRTLYKTYGINLAEASGESHHILPVPAVYLTDEDGIIRFRYFNPDYKERLSPGDILAAAKEHGPRPVEQ